MAAELACRKGLAGLESPRDPDFRRRCQHERRAYDGEMKDVITSATVLNEQWAEFGPPRWAGLPIPDHRRGLVRGDAPPERRPGQDPGADESFLALRKAGSPPIPKRWEHLKRPSGHCSALIEKAGFWHCASGMHKSRPSMQASSSTRNATARVLNLSKGSRRRFLPNLGPAEPNMIVGEMKNYSD